MEQRGTFVAFEWLGTIVLSVADAVQYIRRGQQQQPQLWYPQSHNKLDA
jgi:hypothetical protein